VATFKEQGRGDGGIPDDDWPSAISWSELDALHARIGRHFARSEPRQRALSYLHGLLAQLERKNGRSLAHFAEESRADGMQRLLSQAKWSSDAVRDEVQDFISERTGNRRAIVAVAETTFEKRGSTPAGVGSHFNQAAGRFVRSQLGVFLTYAAPSRAVSLIDRRLYLPPVDRSEAAKPALTKARLAQDMLAQARRRHIPWSWVTGSDVFGSDGGLRDWLERQGMPYLLEIPPALRSLTGEDRVKVASQLAELTTAGGGVKWYRTPNGAGPVDLFCDEWLRLPLSTLAGSGLVRCLLLHRTKRLQNLTCYVAVAPAKTPLPDLIAVAGTSMSVDVAFRLARRCAGLDQYQVRGEEAWYRHVTLAMVAYAFLVATVFEDGELLSSLHIPTGPPDATTAALPAEAHIRPA
jgi:SRSO17 transposase